MKHIERNMVMKSVDGKAYLIQNQYIICSRRHSERDSKFSKHSTFIVRSSVSKRGNI